MWDPIFGGEFDREAKNLSNAFRDKRVRYYKDPDSLAGKVWEKVLKTQREIAWDIYLLYGPDAKWEDQPAEPDFWMHQLFGVKIAPYMTTEKFTSELKLLLDRTASKDRKTEMTQTSSTRGQLRVELLYFDSCPSYKTALANIEAALREKGLKARVDLIKVESEEAAERVGFQGSPSVRINGKDLEGRDQGFSFSCRLYRANGKTSAAPSKEAIIEKLESLIK